MEHVTSLLAELQQPDERSLIFNSYGLGGRLAPADAANFQAASIARAVLADDVPEDVRDNFERARQLHLYGVLQYEFFTASSDYALLTLEGALRARFLSHYEQRVPVVRKGIQATLLATTFEHVRQASGYLLRSPSGATHDRPLGLKALLAWARREQLLRGTRSRIVHQALSSMRDHAAHPEVYTLSMPPRSARTLDDVAETINRLWGHDTPGGRLFPAPLRREPRVAAIAPGGRGGKEQRIDQLGEVGADGSDWRYAVFLAAELDELIGIVQGGIAFTQRPGFQTTRFPCERLWEGSREDLRGEISRGSFIGCEDTVRYLDRLFFIRVEEEGEAIDQARSAYDLLALPAPIDGRWYAIVADAPLDAWAHVRDHEPNPAEKADLCPECQARIEARSVPYTEVFALARDHAP